MSKKRSILLEEIHQANSATGAVLCWQVKEKTNIAEPRIGARLRREQVDKLIADLDSVKIIGFKK